MATRRLLIPALVLAAPAGALAQESPDVPAPAEAAPAEAAPAEATPAPAPVPAPAPAPTAKPAVASAATPPLEPEEPVTVVVAETPTMSWYDALQVNGFASVAYSFNTNRPMDEANGVRVFDTEDGSINIDVVELVVQKPAGAPGQAGFRVDLTAGSSIPAAAASAGLFRDPDGTGQDFDLQQGFVSYIAKIGDGLRLDAGKFVTHMGYEVIEGFDGFNDNYSRSILFGYAIPFTHTGVKLSYPIAENMSAMVMVANGWDNVADNNDGKTLGAQVAGTFGPAAVYLNYVGGPEQADENGNFRQVFDVVATYAVTDAVSLGFNADLGFEPEAAVGPDGADTALWMGAAVYARWAATDAFQLALRGEVFDDPDGVRTGLAQTIAEATLSPAFKLGDNIVLRGDLRFDRSDVEAFMTSDGTSKQQVTIALNALGIM